MIDPIELHALADGEVTPEERRAIEAALSASPPAQAEYRAIVELKQVLRTSVAPIECRQEWKACVGRLNEIDKARRIEGFVGRYAWGLCGSFFVAIVAGAMLTRTPDSSRVQSADLARMVSNLVPTRMPKASSNGEMDRWVDSLLGQARRSIDPNRMQVRGAATGYLDGRPVTRLTLRDGMGDLALIVVSDVLPLENMPEIQRDRGYRQGHIMGMNCVVWSDGRNTLALVGDREVERLADTASRLTIE